MPTLASLRADVARAEAMKSGAMRSRMLDVARRLLADAEAKAAPVPTALVVVGAPAAIESTTGSWRVEVRRMDDRGYGIRDGAFVRFQGGLSRTDAVDLVARLCPADCAASRIVADTAPVAPMTVTYADGSPDGMGQYPDAR